MEPDVVVLSAALTTLALTWKWKTIGGFWAGGVSHDLHMFSKDPFAIVL